MSTATTWAKSDRQRERERLRRRDARRSGAVATASTVGVFGLAVWALVSSPGWPRVRETFFSWSEFAGSFGDVLSGFWVNVQIFLIAEPIILVVGLAVALARGVRTPAFFPLRALAVAYTDVFRGIPTILLVYLVGFGVPALNLSGAPSSPLALGVIALVLSYGAYVAEVFRAGIASVHPSQLAAARSLGLSRPQALRYVVLPQAIRTVVPPLLNDFASLQKDTALVAVLGVIEALRQAQIHSALTFNYTPYLAAALLFVLLTVPLARFTDWLAARAERRRAPGDR
ncbi:amino acid ABC transporter membrane protein (PAAT family) [Actinocorallia herbida]|uniref:Amino acid ABC transporter membrane protein (PAAT family) n=1 Tax=Actinocorallia herbida TaxID=58109 RepID=A0A3N1CX39_9ACTN|nr:amino acid ABC transporter permease [Actinocorallia herbida]ROO85869.1 amino acid ABC transporter membrane protein (PAAT family) [Actinocorallia herbida]